MSEPDWSCGPNSMPSIVEPRAELRSGAAAHFELYSAYVAAGFTSAQALTILLGLIAAASSQ